MKKRLPLTTENPAPREPVYLFDRLAPEIQRARVYYDAQVDPSLPGVQQLFDFALVDVLVYANRRVATHIW